MTNSQTLFLVLAEFGMGHIPLERCCHHFGMSPDEAKRAATRQALPVATFRLGSQKSPWLVAADALAEYIDQQRRDAETQWRKIHAA